MKLCKAIILLLSSSVIFAHAEEQPLWELGAGMAAFQLPDYLGSDQSSNYVLPLPYFTYRGEYIRADRQGLRGLIFENNKLDVRMSVSGSLPVNSKDDKARRGMDDLDLMVEAGPTVQYKLSQSNFDEWRIDLPLRAAFTLGGEFMRHQGWIFSPSLQYERDLESGWIVTTSAGPIYTDQRYSAYFYDVDRSDVLPDRAYYQSDAGYGGARFAVGLRKRFGQWFVGSFLRYYDLKDIANADSPLVKTNEYASVGFFVGYVFAESTRLVNDTHRQGHEADD
jgi:outer membrane protein